MSNGIIDIVDRVTVINDIMDMSSSATNVYWTIKYSSLYQPSTHPRIGNCKGPTLLTSRERNYRIIPIQDYRNLLDRIKESQINIGMKPDVVVVGFNFKYQYPGIETIDDFLDYISQSEPSYLEKLRGKFSSKPDKLDFDAMVAIIEQYHQKPKKIFEEMHEEFVEQTRQLSTLIDGIDSTSILLTVYPQNISSDVSQRLLKRFRNRYQEMTNEYSYRNRALVFLESKDEVEGITFNDASVSQSLPALDVILNRGGKERLDISSRKRDFI